MSALKNTKTEVGLNKKVKVLIAEDSSYQRKVLSDMLSEHPQIDVIDIARNGEEAIEKIENTNPDVLLLDLIMPKMDGLTLYRYLSKHYPVPTIVFSALNPSEASKTLNDSIQTLLLGAFDYIIKPSGVWKEEFPKFKEQLINKVLLASQVKVKKKILEKKLKLEKKKSKYVINHQDLNKFFQVKVSKLPQIQRETELPCIVVMGASVGGPKTLKSIIKEIPAHFPGAICIVQHLNLFFMNQFAESMNELCKLKVKIPKNGEIIKSSHIYIAPGDKHMEILLKNSNSRAPRIRIFDGESVNFCKPSIDILFYSAAKTFNNKSLAILLTGMGKDGVQGLAAIQKAGGVTIAESEETAILYGMPKFAAEYGYAEIISPNYHIKDYILRYVAKLSSS